ncbi:hypothetical protein [Aurantiacibacter rhizosphaerae]|uniref:Uncharacterized protein n=1 Tax=Aurantiacibacter rhizosphaerae TaxID=2691582 RepID=A0A844XA26_9SPHN|nr:hypothetical protein [Aurantiacibacter rhizosphaerae]MWV27217.1 hypothetical protein [Aurantiacibacter rhizosphaerae]
MADTSGYGQPIGGIAQAAFTAHYLNAVASHPIAVRKAEPNVIRPLA